MNRIEPQTVRLIVASALIALGTAAHAAGPSPPRESSIAPSAVPGVSVAASASAQDEKLRLELANATTRLSSVEASVTRSADRADEVARRTSRYSAYTVLGTALLTALLSLAAQGLLMRHQRNINRADSEAKVANTYVEWQLQQLSELYGPVRALLGQSNVLYRQMNRALVAADATRFQLVPGEDFDDQEFQIYLCGQWVRFRTVKHLEEVYNKEYGVEPFFDDVIDIGARLADVIREKAGFARPDDGELVHVMGQYLAHYLVLKRLHDRAKAGEMPHLNPADEQAIFPNRIQNLVDSGFKSINQQVLAWRGLETTKS